MICTEKDAARKWCPHVRHVPILDDKALSPANRFSPESGPDEDNPSFARCIGSRCMMWVWTDNRYGFDQYERGEIHDNEFAPANRRGACGLIRSGS